MRPVDCAILILLAALAAAALLHLIRRRQTYVGKQLACIAEAVCAVQDDAVVRMWKSEDKGNRLFTY